MIEMDQEKTLGRVAIEGDSPVSKHSFHASSIPSTAGHVESCRNVCRPLHKPKYYLMTDSEPVP